MYLSRRALSLGLAGTLLTPQGLVSQGISKPPPLPDPKTFQTGDLLWPKRPEDMVLFSDDPAARQDAEIWKGEKSKYLTASLVSEGQLSKDQLSALERLDYREFIAKYWGDHQPTARAQFLMARGVYIGHVALLDLEANGTAFVIEATPKKSAWGCVSEGVSRRPYEEWLKEKPRHSVWHGRLRKAPGVDWSAEDRARVVVEAKKYLDRPYCFWNFNLNDDRSFYCSKLIWLSVFRSLGVAVDGQAEPKRAFWLSPKQLLNLPVVNLLHVPGDF